MTSANTKREALVVASINDVVEAFVKPIQVVEDNLNKLAQGNVPPRI